VLGTIQIEPQHVADAIEYDLANARRIDCTLAPSSWATSFTDNVRFIPVLSFVHAPHGTDHTVLDG
jgi:hypothetical protein